MTIRDDFPFFKHNDTVYLDSAASSQKPKAVLEQQRIFDQQLHCNIHRGNYQLSRQATDAYEQTRQQVANFIHAGNDNQVVFTSGTTEAINLVAAGYVQTHIKAHHNIVLTELEHHANILPWQQVAEQTGCQLRFIPLLGDSQLDLTAAAKLIDSQTFIVAMTHISNVTGQQLPVESISALAKQQQALMLVDGAQAMAHIQVDVQQLDVDFYCFSGHKMFAPTGVGILYGRYELLEAMRPQKFGGAMVEFVSKQGSRFLAPPQRFETGTPAISSILALGKAIDYIQQLGWQRLQQTLHSLQQPLMKFCQTHPRITLYSHPQSHGIISFNIQGEHASDVAMLLDEQQISSRAGHHCAMILMQSLRINGCVRLSLAIYNNQKDIERCIQALEQCLLLLEADDEQ